MFVQGITDDFAERFALMICSFYAPGQGFCVIGWAVQALCAFKTWHLLKTGKKILFLLINLTTLKSEEEQLIT